jgi:hypothetical protein
MLFLCQQEVCMAESVTNTNTAPQNMGGGVYVYKGTYTPGGTVNGDVVQVN